MKKYILANVFGVFFMACGGQSTTTEEEPTTTTTTVAGPGQSATVQVNLAHAATTNVEQNVQAASCVTNADCPESLDIDGVAKKTLCMVTKTGDFCLPRCESPAVMCAHFLPGFTCKNLTSVDGAYTLDFCAK